MERLEAFKNFMRSGIQVVLDRIQNDIHNDLEGSDYLCSHIDRLINVLVQASSIYDVPPEIELGLRAARQTVTDAQSKQGESSKLFRNTGNRGRPAVVVPREQIELYIGYGFSQVKIAAMFGVSTKTIQRRIAEFELPTRQHDPLSDMELDTIV